MCPVHLPHRVLPGLSAVACSAAGAIGRQQQQQQHRSLQVAAMLLQLQHYSLLLPAAATAVAGGTVSCSSSCGSGIGNWSCYDQQQCLACGACAQALRCFYTSMNSPFNLENWYGQLTQSSVGRGSVAQRLMRKPHVCAVERHMPPHAPRTCGLRLCIGGAVRALDSKATASGICSKACALLAQASGIVCAVACASCTPLASMKPASICCGSGAYYFATFLPALTPCERWALSTTTIQLYILCTNRLAGHGGCVCRLVFAILCQQACI
jgi:hypothetical protein